MPNSSGGSALSFSASASIPYRSLRRMEPFALGICSLCWALWTAGVTLRWMANVYLWHWRVLVPLSAGMELLAFAIFFHAVSGHEPAQPNSAKTRFEPWVLVVMAGTLGFMGMLLANAGAAVYLANRGKTPAFPAEFDQRYLVLSAWGFTVPFVWGFSAKWLPVFLGLRPTRTGLLLCSTAINSMGVIAALFGSFRVATVILLVGAVLAGLALRLFEKTQQPPKTKSVYASYPTFIRIAYIWLVIAAVLGIWAAHTGSPGVWGASRHALTVGFIATMVFCVGQRVLPAFGGMRLLFSPRLMGAGLILLTIGCIVRVSSEVLAYQGYSPIAWKWLPVSAVIELGAVTFFAFNMLCTFARRPAPLRSQASRP